MATLTMPHVGEGIAEGTVNRWLKHEGDRVEVDEPLVEVETDKAVTEIPSPYSGRLARIHVQEGETVPVGAPLAEFEAAGEATEAPPQAPGAPAAEPEGAREYPGPERAEAAGVSGDGTDAADEYHGVLFRPTTPSTASRPSAERAAGNGGGTRPVEAPGQPWYSPVVLRLAAEHGVDLRALEGTGQGGRVTRKDVLRHLEERPAGVQQDVPSVPATAEREDVEAAVPGEDVERVALSATRRSIARHMLESHQTIPVAWMVVEADVTGLVALRDRAKEGFRRTEGVNLTYLPFCVQAIVASLKQHLGLNATYTDDGVDVHHRYHMGIAVATDSGLLTPVLRDADRKSIAGLAREIEDLGRRARERSVAIEELRGATFTINNTGAFGSIVSQPIVPVGQVAIITTEAVRLELRVNPDGTFGQRAVMNLCISFDHRALDGAEVGAFMREVVQRLEAYREDQSVY